MGRGLEFTSGLSRKVDLAAGVGSARQRKEESGSTSCSLFAIAAAENGLSLNQLAKGTGSGERQSSLNILVSVGSDVQTLASTHMCAV